MDGFDQIKGISQLLLSPLFLLREILGTVLPGALLLLLLAHKGNPVLRHAWLDSPLGYKTNMAVFMLLAYVVGKALVLPILFIGASKGLYHRIAADVRGPQPLAPSPPGNPYGSDTEALRDMLHAAVTDGPILSTPGLVDRLSLEQSNAAFHVGTGCALLIAAASPGDSLRWLEAVVGFAMLLVGVHKAREFTKMYMRHVGIGLADLFARMTPQQIQCWAAFLKAMKQVANGVQNPPEQPGAVEEPQGGQQRTVS